MQLAFCASTGRTATLFMAATLNSLKNTRALHKGHKVADVPIAKLPLINLQNRRAWVNSDFALETVRQMRDLQVLSEAAEDAETLIDIAY